MKHRLGFVMAVAATALVGACDKGANAPTEPSKVSNPSEPATVVAPVEKSAATNVAPTAAPVVADQAPAAGHAAHAGCAEHAKLAGAGGNEADCPFPEEKAAGIDGCGAHAAVEPTKTATGSHYGTPFAIGEAKPLAQALTGATDGQELSVRVSGQIEKVCQKKGCWLVVKDGEVEARVTMKDHAFTVPVDSKGKPAQVEGLLKVRVFSEAQAKHLAEDGGEDPSKITGEKKEYVLTATSIEIGG